SDFGLQLRAKQKLKGHYGDISEKQFRKTYEEANRRRGDTSENLIGLLESRLDAVVYRAKFVPTPFAARQFVNHGHVLVNGKRVNIAPYRGKPGDAAPHVVRSPCAPRQFVTHGHVLVNGKRVNIASYRVKPGDVVSVREKSR